MRTNPELSIVLPCRNEEAAIALCIAQIREVLSKSKINGEIIVADSSADRSAEIARHAGAKVVKHNKEGYGAACLAGIKAAKGKYIFMADADCTYDFRNIPLFLEQLKMGYDLVIGNRFTGRIEKGAMPFLHRYAGNPILSLTLRLFFGAKVADSHSGMRAILKSDLERLDLRTTGMEFASEMIIKAAKKKLKIKEVPINYYRRKGKSKLKSFSDGWRHLRFMLLYSPMFLFFVPGISLSFFGLFFMITLYYNALTVFGLNLYYHPMFIASVLVISGYQLIIFALFAKTYAITHLGEKSKFVNWINRYFTIERASLFGILIGLAGILIFFAIFLQWINSGFGALQQVKNSIAALTLIVLGLQTIFSSFMLSILGIREK